MHDTNAAGLFSMVTLILGSVFGSNDCDFLRITEMTMIIMIILLIVVMLRKLKLMRLK